MVMALPNTQYVAHEFVRQYYTMLHKDPSQLHRFYTKESRLTHGVSPNAKSEEPVCGQEAIYEKIAQLNFQNCHAKIKSIDSHPTIGGGVVIQVTGELSNSGMGMRKFMQTFVLAQQDPKKYNVYNDIFRYQDETFEDTENDETVDGTVESENGYHHTEAAVSNTIEDEREELDEDSSDPETSENATSQEQNFEPYVDEVVEPEKQEGTEFVEQEFHDVDESRSDEKTYGEPLAWKEEEPVHEVDDDVQEDGETYEEPEKEEVLNGVEDEKPSSYEEKPEPVEQPKEPEVEVPSKPVTWAALAKKNTVPATQAPVVPKPVVKKTSPAPQKPVKRREEPPPLKKDFSDDSRRRAGPPPDEHQIFIGNLPNNITEEEVRKAFQEYGTIVEIRLNPKNFGFVAFSGPEAPQEILKKLKTITIQNQTINTEVKKSVSGGGRGGSGGVGGGGGFRRDREKDSNRNRGDFKNRNTGGGGNRPGKSSSFAQKQPRNEEGKSEKSRDFKSSRDQRSSRR